MLCVCECAKSEILITILRQYFDDLKIVLGCVVGQSSSVVESDNECLQEVADFVFKSHYACVWHFLTIRRGLRDRN